MTSDKQDEFIVDYITLHNKKLVPVHLLIFGTVAYFATCLVLSNSKYINNIGQCGIELIMHC